LYSMSMRLPTRSLRQCLLILSLQLFTASAYAQPSALEGLLSVPAAFLPTISAPAPSLVETYPDYEQDRKPATQLYNAGGVRVLSGVRFERNPATDVYSWRELKIEDSQLDEAYFGFRSGGVGHNFLMFSFKDGTKLVIEALPWKKKGEVYSPFGCGVSGKYPLVWNLVEWHGFLETAVGHDGLYVDVYPMKLSRAEKLRLLDEAITEAVRDHSGEKYNTFFNSCSTNALMVFGRATGNHLIVGKLLPSVVVEHLSLLGFLGERQRSDSSNWSRR